MARPLKLESVPVAQLCVHLPPELLRHTKRFAITRGGTPEHYVIEVEAFASTGPATTKRYRIDFSRNAITLEELAWPALPPADV